jgi:sialidase-1
MSKICWLGFSLLFVLTRGVMAQVTIELDDEVRAKCLEILRGGLKGNEFWPAMHAAEGLSKNGLGAEVTTYLEPKLPQETDDQRRCGLARELVRAGDTSKTKIMVDILAGKDPHGHVHACESLYKVFQTGDAALLRQAMEKKDKPLLAIMAAAALARSGDAGALMVLRDYVRHEDAMIARTAAWVLARVGNAHDIPELRLSKQRFADPLTLAYFEHALAALGDSNAAVALVANLRHPDPAVRTYACEFAPDARAILARDRLIELLNDSTLDIRIRAADALLRLSRPVDKPRSAMKE